VAEAILGLPIRSNVFGYVFLPTLLFQATLGMNLRRMLDDWMPILVLAVVAVVVATVSVGHALHLFSPLSLAACLLNHAAAIAPFGLFMGFVMLGAPDPSLGDALARFPVLILGGALTGWLAARIGVWIMAMFGRHARAQISISVALPYLAYIGAEQSIGASGVIAVVAAGLTLNLTGPGRLPPQAWTNLREVWDLLAHWAGALIFILAARLIRRLLEDVRAEDFVLIGVVVVAAIAARAAILFGLLPLLILMRVSPAVERPYRVAILWGGLRGAAMLALALAVTESVRVPIEVKRVVGILATGFTLFTLIVQGATLRTVIGWLGLDRLSPVDEALSRQVIAVALQTVREDVARITEDYDLTHDIVRSEAKRFGERFEQSGKTAEDSADILDRDRITLRLIALAGHERDTILMRVRERKISARMAEQVLSDADQLIEGARSGGRIGCRRAARRSVAYGRGFRAAVVLHSRLGVSAPLKRMTADRFELLLSQRLILRDLGGFIDGRIRRIHGRKMAALLCQLLSRRIEAAETVLEGLRLQYPGYAEELERRFIRRTAPRLEEREYTAMREDGLIGAEVFTALMQDLAARRAAAEHRPRLDIALRWRDLVRQFPLFSDLDDAALKGLGRALRTRYVNAGDVIIARDSGAKRVYFIASGALELESAGQSWRLGRGEMFDQMAILMKKARRAEVRAIAPSTLLLLDEERFRRRLASSAALRQAVRTSAEKRGIEPDALLFGIAPAAR
jgi:CPA1 family monovalent cation:H+ antiporter